MKRANKILVAFALLFFLTKSISAQDPQFSQFYAAPLYLCPSFAGASDGSRAVLNVRDQWPAIPGAFITYAFSIDHYFMKKKSGVGLLFVRDQAGTGKLRNTNIGLQYSYNFRVYRDWHIRPGIHFIYSWRNIDYSALIFGDQISLSGSAPVSVEIFDPSLNKARYFDASASVLAYSRLHWFGIAVEHLFMPNQSFDNGTLGSESKLPVKYTVFGGTKMGLNQQLGKYREESLSFAFIYKSQEKFDQLDLGVYWLKSPFVLGIWYRGIPLLKSYEKGYGNNDAVVLLVGYKLLDYNLSIGYSYDFTISRLITSTNGSHELSIIYEKELLVKRKRVIIPCPKF